MLDFENAEIVYLCDRKAKCKDRCDEEFCVRTTNPNHATNQSSVDLINIFMDLSKRVDEHFNVEKTFNDRIIFVEKGNSGVSNDDK